VFEYGQNFRVVSPGIEVVWAGWRSSLYDLQCSGWQMAASEDPMGFGLIIYIHHPQIQGALGMGKLDRTSYRELTMPGFREMFRMNINFDKEEIFRTVHQAELSNAIDVTPRLEDMSVTTRTVSMKDFRIFQPIIDSPEIILKEASMDQILQLALEKQEPSQVEFREQTLRMASQPKAQLRLVA